MAPTDAASLAQMASEGHEHIWCRPGALDGIAYLYVGLVLRRVDSARRAMAPEEGVQIGMWEIPRPVISSVAAHEWSTAAADAKAPEAWEAFLATDRDAAADFKSKLTAADTGDGALIAIANVTACAADLASELCPPEQGLPRLRPPLAATPPVPGAHAIGLSALARGDPAAGAASGLPSSGPMDGRHPPLGEAHDMQRARHVRRLRGRAVALWSLQQSRAASSYASAKAPRTTCRTLDGVGTWNYFDVLWRRRDSDGWLEPMDFGKRVTDHKDIEFLFELFSPPGGPRCSDQELLSMLSRKGGAVLKAGGADGPPRQIRIDKNLSSLDTRIRQVAAPTLKLVKAGLYRAVAIREADGKLKRRRPMPAAPRPGVRQQHGRRRQGPSSTRRPPCGGSAAGRQR